MLDPRRSTSCSTSTRCSRRWPATSSSARESGADAVVIEVATPVCRTPSDVEAQLRQAPLLRHRRRAGAGAPRRLGGNASVQPVRAAAHHRARPLPQPRRPAAVRRAARADLRPARPRRGGRPRQGDPGRERVAAAPRAAARALGELHRSGAASDGPIVVAADDLRRVPAVGPAAARFRNYTDYAEVVGQLEKTGCIADYTHIWWDIRPHPRLGTVEVRICDAVTHRRGRGGDRRVLPGPREAPVRALRRRRGDPHLSPHPHDREQVARRALRDRGAGHGSRDGKRNRVPVAQLVRRT